MPRRCKDQARIDDTEVVEPDRRLGRGGPVADVAEAAPGAQPAGGEERPLTRQAGATARRLRQCVEEVTVEEFRIGDFRVERDAGFGRQLLFLLTNEEWLRRTSEQLELKRCASSTPRSSSMSTSRSSHRPRSKGAAPSGCPSWRYPPAADGLDQGPRDQPRGARTPPAPACSSCPSPRCTAGSRPRSPSSCWPASRADEPLDRRAPPRATSWSCSRPGSGACWRRAWPAAHRWTSPTRGPTSRIRACSTPPGQPAAPHRHRACPGRGAARAGALGPGRGPGRGRRPRRAAGRLTPARDARRTGRRRVRRRPRRSGRRAHLVRRPPARPPPAPGAPASAAGAPGPPAGRAAHGVGARGPDRPPHPPRRDRRGGFSAARRRPPAGPDRGAGAAAGRRASRRWSVRCCTPARRPASWVQRRLASLAVDKGEAVLELMSHYLVPADGYDEDATRAFPGAVAGGARAPARRGGAVGRGTRRRRAPAPLAVSRRHGRAAPGCPTGCAAASR